MTVFKCKMCGGELDINSNETVAKCPYCGTTQTIPFLDSDKKARLFNRANEYRLNNDFDKAYSSYETILNDNIEESEAYWGLVLSEYGVEYVEDPNTHKRIPTCHRTRVNSITSNANYKKALEYADVENKMIYEQEAEELDKIQKKILSISSKEEPYDVFICYKETDDNNNRTNDSVVAQNIYDQLTKDGLKVFFSRISLEDKLGQNYEPYIFNALNTSKVMLLVTSSNEHCNSVWVKNEWKRFLNIINDDNTKVLIPVLSNMSPYELPDELQKFQVQDMNKIGAMQDLLRGVKKIIGFNDDSVVNLNRETLDKILKEREDEQKRKGRLTLQILGSLAVLGCAFTGFVLANSISLFRIGGYYFEAPDLGLTYMAGALFLFTAIAIIINIFKGMKSKISNYIYNLELIIGIIAIAYYYFNNYTPTGVTVLYTMLAVLALISNIFTYLSKKPLMIVLIVFTVAVSSTALYFTFSIPNKGVARNANTDQVIIENDYLNVRKGPSTDSKVIDAVYKDQIFNVISSTNGEEETFKWYYIEIKEGSYGYIRLEDQSGCYARILPKN